MSLSWERTQGLLEHLIQKDKTDIANHWAPDGTNKKCHMSQKILKHVWMNNLLQTTANAIRMLCAKCAVQVWSWGRGIQGECGNGGDLSWSVLLTAFYLVPRHKTSRPQTKTRTIELLATSNRHLPLFVTLSSLTDRVHDTRVMQCNVDHDKIEFLFW